ncbi:hypothetical protein CC77DRAFT_391926 [Alternaria alternata]|uniref:DUF7708 domain-containing protein n=1 Tax=Alternaria alternata TaxID=5599 RepID=A0A177DAS4_ALTAL|nr:hypothetical protein CC77DRAFT_391926 [Alternaria alternata]OAG16202.1 hypothetical protein CC77DRAFT_391926 [Alternaria alternata]
MQSQSHWYSKAQASSSTNSAEDAFKEAISVFQLDPRTCARFDRVQQLRSLNDLEIILNEARSKYEQQHEDKKIAKWLSQLSSRICHYGQIFDVLVQHHPEYVSLAWGAMKFLFVLVENHGKQLRVLAKGLSQIADVLPRIEFANALYPTARMQQAVSETYSKIIRFFLRAERWFQQSKLRHTWEALSRPTELYYSDLIQEVGECTKTIEVLANAGAQAEQRDMHLEVQELNKRLQISEQILQEMRGLLISYQSIQTSANLDTNQRLTDLQLNQIMDFLSGANALDPLKALQYRAFMSARTKGRQTRPDAGSQFWLNPKFTAWESASSPTMIMVKGEYSTRFQVQNFAVDVITNLRNRTVPTLWALKSVRADGATSASAIDIIKGLICQAIQHNISQHTERSLALSCAQFRAADSIEQWLDLLARTIASFPQLYIIVDLEAVGGSYLNGISWLCQLTAMFQRHNSGKWISRLKILLVSYGSMMRQQDDLLNFRDIVVPVKSSHTRVMLQGRSPGSISPGLGRSRPVRGSMRTRYGGSRARHSTLIGT